MDLQADAAERTLSLVLRDIGKGNVAPCYLLYGEEEFLITEALEKITALLLPPGSRDLNLFGIDGDDNLDFLFDTLIMPPLLPGRKIVLAKNTRLLHSRQTLPELIEKIRERLDREPGRAAGDFLHVMRIAGWRLDDLKDEGWKKFTDEQWRETTGESGEGRETWLPRVVEICVRQGLDAEKARDDADRLGDLLISGLPVSNHLILTSDAVDKRKKLFKIISERGAALSFPRLKGEARQRQALMGIANDLLAARGKRMTTAAWSALGEKTGFNLRSSMGAVEKLITYTGEKTTIEESDVGEVVGKTKDDILFDLTGALVGRDAVKALLILKNLLDQGVNHLVILTMIIREVRLLLQAGLFLRSGILGSYHSQMDFNEFQRSAYPAIRAWKDTAGAEEGGGNLATQHPYVVFNALRNAERFHSRVLKGALEDLLAIDLAIKTSSRDPRLLLERFLVDFCA